MYLISPVSITTLDSFVGTVKVHWADNSLNQGQGAAHYKVFVDGVFYANTTANEVIVSGLVNGASYRFDVLRMSNLDNVTFDDITLFAAVKVGSRIKVTWNPIVLADNPDFYAYQLYWNAGTHSTADTLLAEIIGANKTSFITGALQDGLTYKFALGFRDYLGNASTLGTTELGTVETLPEPVTNPGHTYDSSTRKATITATPPVSQDADCIGYAVYSNYLAGHGLQGAINLSGAQRLALVPSGALTYTSFELHAGNWQFGIRAVDNMGLESDFSPIEFNLYLDGSTLLEKPVPAVATITDAQAIAEAKIQIAISLNQSTGDFVNIYLDDVATYQIPIEPGQTDYSFTTEILTDGHQYKLQANAEADGFQGALSDSVYVTADGSAPDGDKTIMLELVA